MLHVSDFYVIGNECLAPNSDLDQMDPFDFEHLIGQLLSNMGLTVEVTKKSSDQGIDIIAASHDPITGGRYIVQCKRYAPQNKVGEPEVRDLFGVVSSERASKGILVTTSSFSKAARDWAEGKPISLIDGKRLSGLLEEHGFGNSSTIARPAPNLNPARQVFRRLLPLAVMIDEVLDESEVFRSKRRNWKGFYEVAQQARDIFEVAIDRFDGVLNTATLKAVTWSNREVTDRLIAEVRESAEHAVDWRQRLAKTYLEEKYSRLQKEVVQPLDSVLKLMSNRITHLAEALEEAEEGDLGENRAFAIGPSIRTQSRFTMPF
jgi:Restriction endonuclease